MAEGRGAAWSLGSRTNGLESGCSPEASLVRPDLLQTVQRER